VRRAGWNCFLDHVRSWDSMVLIEHFGSAVTVLVNVTCNSLRECVRETERESERDSWIVGWCMHTCVRERGTERNVHVCSLPFGLIIRVNLQHIHCLRFS
jgi:ubiquitin C-terminal hydrolase